jgi:hypothetical protein
MRLHIEAFRSSPAAQGAALQRDALVTRQFSRRFHVLKEFFLGGNGIRHALFV